MFLGRKETEYLGVIVGNGTLRTAPDKIAAVRDWPLPKAQKQIVFFNRFARTMLSLFTIFQIVLHH